MGRRTVAKTVYFDLSFPVGEGGDRTASFTVEAYGPSAWDGCCWTIIDSYWTDTKEPLAAELVEANVNRIQDATMGALYDY